MQTQTPAQQPLTLNSNPRRPVPPRVTRKATRVRQTAHPDRVAAGRKTAVRV